MSLEEDMREELEERILELPEPRMLCDSQGQPLEEEIEIWVHNYFQSLLDIFNGFFCHLSPAEALSRMENIPFDQLVREQLEDEKEAVIAIAVQIINELKSLELEFMRSYVD